MNTRGVAVKNKLKIGISVSAENDVLGLTLIDLRVYAQHSLTCVDV